MIMITKNDKAYCTLRNETKRIEKSVLCELRNQYFAN